MNNTKLIRIAGKTGEVVSNSGIGLFLEFNMNFRKCNSVSKFAITLNAIKSEDKLYKFFHKDLLFVIILTIISLHSYQSSIKLLIVSTSVIFGRKDSLTIGDILI